MIKYLDLKAGTAMHGKEIAEAVQRVVEGGWYLLGEEVRRFEEQYAAYIGTRHCIACSNGLDALYLTLRAWKELGVLADARHHRQWLAPGACGAANRHYANRRQPH